ncbi:MAG: hypothetical protein AAFR44_06375, partial [Pseudomonadota bacterium]
SLGESPLEGHPIRIKPLPGQRGRYVAERNALMLERGAAGWHARWDLEISGLTEALPLTSGLGGTFSVRMFAFHSPQ